MMWLFAALLSAISKSAERLFHRKVMIKADCFAYAFVFTIIGALFYLPLIWIFGFTMPTETIA